MRYVISRAPATRARRIANGRSNARALPKSRQGRGGCTRPLTPPRRGQRRHYSAPKGATPPTYHHSGKPPQRKQGEKAGHAGGREARKACHASPQARPAARMRAAKHERQQGSRSREASKESPQEAPHGPCAPFCGMHTGKGRKGRQGPKCAQIAHVPPPRPPAGSRKAKKRRQNTPRRQINTAQT